MTRSQARSMRPGFSGFAASPRGRRRLSPCTSSSLAGSDMARQVPSSFVPRVGRDKICFARHVKPGHNNGDIVPNWGRRWRHIQQGLGRPQRAHRRIRYLPVGRNTVYGGAKLPKPIVQERRIVVTSFDSNLGFIGMRKHPYGASEGHHGLVPSVATAMTAIGPHLYQPDHMGIQAASRRGSNTSPSRVTVSLSLSPTSMIVSYRCTGSLAFCSCWRTTSSISSFYGTAGGGPGRGGGKSGATGPLV